MKAIILAAGRGERLMPLTRDVPKSLIDIGDNLTILESQIDALSVASEIKKVVLVTGYLTEKIEAEIKKKRYQKLPIEIVYNPFFDVSNNLISLWMARYYMDSDFLVINGDDIFKPKVIKGLLNFEPSKEIMMTIDRKDRYEEEDMKVFIRRKKVYGVSKKINPKKANGESVGIIRFKNRGASLMKETLEEMARQVKYRNVFWLEAIQQIIDKNFPVYYYEIAPADWVEVDIHDELNFVQEHLKIFTKKVREWY